MLELKRMNMDAKAEESPTRDAHSEISSQFPWAEVFIWCKLLPSMINESKWRPWAHCKAWIEPNTCTFDGKWWTWNCKITRPSSPQAHYKWQNPRFTIIWKGGPSPFNLCHHPISGGTYWTRTLSLITRPLSAPPTGLAMKIYVVIWSRS